MKLTLTLDLDNAAFKPDPRPEVARIIRRLFPEGGFGGFDFAGSYTVHDLNGNTVGTVAVEEN